MDRVRTHDREGVGLGGGQGRDRDASARRWISGGQERRLVGDVLRRHDHSVTGHKSVERRGGRKQGGKVE